MSVREPDSTEMGPTIWAPMVSLSVFLLVLGGLVFMHPGIFGEAARSTFESIGPGALLVGVLLLLLSLARWGRANLGFDRKHREFAATFVGRQRTGMFLFLASEAMFFFAFFWAFVRFGVDPEIAGSSTWPPLGIRPEDPWGSPLINTFVLLISGVFAVVGHQLFLAGHRRAAVGAFAITIVLGGAFLVLQALEFASAPFSYADGSFASLFFLAVGFHGLHVLIGATLLSLTLFRITRGFFAPRHHFGLEASVWYWHFVDGVWLVLFIVIYWWPVSAIR